MANVLTKGSPLILDTAFAPGAGPAGNLYVSSIEWTPASVGDTFAITNPAGRVKASGVAGPSDAGATKIKTFERGALVLNDQEGWCLSQISAGGQLKIYYTPL